MAKDIKEINIAEIVRKMESQSNEVFNELESILKVELDTDYTKECSLNINLDFDIDLSKLLIPASKIELNTALLKRINTIRYLITNINNALVETVNSLECCESGQTYNKLVVPIFKWIVEDSNGFCLTLLKLTEMLSSIQLTIKNLLCFIKPIPGNPTLYGGDVDPLKTVYGTVFGAEKTLNLLLSGSILDVPIKYLKEIHDKIIGCVGTSPNFIEIDAIYESSEAFKTLKDSTIKSIENLKTDLKYPKPKEPLLIEFQYNEFLNKNPKPELDVTPSHPNFYEREQQYQKDLTEWYEKYNKALSEIKNKNDIMLKDYRIALEKYNSQFGLVKIDQVYNVSAVIEKTSKNHLRKHRSICSCIADILDLDGIHLPKNKIIRTKSDLENLKGQVLYLGVFESHGEFDEGTVPIIENPSALLSEKFERDPSILLTKPNIDKFYYDQVMTCKTISDVIALNENYSSLIYKHKQDINVLQYKLDILNEELNRKKKIDAVATENERNILLGNKDKQEEINELTKKLVELNTINNDTSPEIIELKDKISSLEAEIIKLNEVRQFNHAVVQVVDDSVVECNCNLICGLVQYVLSFIQKVINGFISFLIQYIMKFLLNSESAWLIKYLNHKINCIVGVLNIPKQLDNLNDKFDAEMRKYKNSIREATELECNEHNGAVQDHKTRREKVKDDDIIPDIGNVIVIDDNDFNGGNIDYDIIPDNNDYNVIVKDVIREEKPNGVKPSYTLDCTFDHLLALKWKPKSNFWSIHVDVQVDNLSANNEVTQIPELKQNNDEELSQRSYLYKLMQLAKQNSLDVKIIHSVGNTSTINKFDFEVLNDKIVGITTMYFSDFKELYFYNSVVKEFVLVWQKQDSDVAQNVINDMNNAIKKQEEDAKKEVELPPISIDSKLCSPNSLTITEIKMVYDNPDFSLYSGEIYNDGKVGDDDFQYRFEPLIKDNDGHKVYLVRNNVGIICTFENASGNEFKIVILLDLCNEGQLVNHTYNKETDGLILNDRYPILDYKAINNREPFIFKKSQLISWCTKLFSENGFVNVSTKMGTGEYTNKDESTDEHKGSLGPDSYLKELEKVNTISNSITELSKDLNISFPTAPTPQINVDDTKNGAKNVLGIPLIVLNEELNIIMSIVGQQLVVTNLINGLEGGSFAIDIDLVSDFTVGFSKNNTHYQIYYLNQITKEVIKQSTLATSNIEFDIRNIGSSYKFGKKLLCGKVNNIDIFDGELTATPEEVFTENNDYVPHGFIGYYDFSVFDGQRVYSIPPKYEVVDANDTENIIGKYRQDGQTVTIIGEKPITAYGKYRFDENEYYKTLKYGCLDNFFCRDNILGKSFSLNFWVKLLKDEEGNKKSNKMFLFSDTNNGNFIWYNREEKSIYIKLMGHEIVKRYFNLEWYSDLTKSLTEECDIREWLFCSIEYNVTKSTFTFSAEYIDDFASKIDTNYTLPKIPKLDFEINLQHINGFGKSINVNIVTLLGRYSKTEIYTELFLCEVSAISIIPKVLTEKEKTDLFEYQRKIHKGL